MDLPRKKRAINKSYDEPVLMSLHNAKTKIMESATGIPTDYCRKRPYLFHRFQDVSLQSFSLIAYYFICLYAGDN